MVYLEVCKFERENTSWKYHKLQSSANFFAQRDSRGFSICHSWYLAEQNDTKKALILIFSGFDQKSEFSYQPNIQVGRH